MELKDLIGLHYLTGVEMSVIKDDGDDCNCVKFTLDGITYCAVEDPSDGWRSYCKTLVISDASAKYSFPPLQVLCVMESGKELNDEPPYLVDVLRCIDVITGKEVLAIGTEGFDDYYPGCVMRYTPENMAHNINKTE